jgi:hypothetical protein
MQKSWLFVSVGTFLAAVSVPTTLVSAGNAVVGINVVELKNPKDTRVEQEIATLSDLKAAGVRFIRTGIAPTDEGVEFTKRIYAQGMKLDWVVSIQFPADAPKRPWQPKEFPGMWSGPPLSYADPERFRTYFQTQLDKLEAAGIELAAFELGNELNMTAFNGEFPLPGEGKLFGLNDLYHDREAQQIAKGYLQYLKVLAVLKDIRDHSKLNHHTPILTAGFGAYEAPEGPSPPPAKPGTQVDMVSINATLEFMRANGLDQLVDGYAVHVYPWANSPGQLAAATGRHARLARYVLTQCQSPGHAGGKPCWITEWGFTNNDGSCPVREADQVTLIKEMRSAFRQYAREGRLAGLFYYAWIDTREKLGVYRCDALTESGRLAIADLAPLTPAPPQAKVLLARWRNAKLNDRWSTTAPAPPARDSSYQLEATCGYLMTRGDLARHTVELEDCVSQWPGHPDHMLEAKGVCEQGWANFKRLRTAGWAYGEPQEHTVPLYRCYNPQEHSHFASNDADCEKLGQMEHLLGYVLWE